MATPAELKPLDASSFKVGQVFDFPIYDKEGKLLLGIGRPIESQKQLDALIGGGMFHKPAWAENLIESRKAAGSVTPGSASRLVKRNMVPEDPSESGRQIKMNVPGDEEYFLVKLVGVVGRDAFVITHPMRDDNKLVFAKEGQEWEFRSFYGKSVFRFKSTVEKVLLQPYPLVIMHWPIESDMDQRLIRQSRRASCELPASCKIEKVNSTGSGNIKSYNGLITNLSTGGAAFSCSGMVRASSGSQVNLAFQINLSGRKYVLDLACQLQHHEYDERDDVTNFGLSFQPLNDFQYVAIHGYVLDRLIHRVESPLYSNSDQSPT